MTTRNVNISDNYHNKLKDRLSASSGGLKGMVEIYDKMPKGNLKLIEKSNLIVYQGREWLLQKAFGTQLQGNISDIYNKDLKWFGLGIGGGESGNPMQAGTTRAWDTDLTQPVVIKPDGTLPIYAPRVVGLSSVDGYFKSFTNVVRRQDFANPYVIGADTFYPEIIAEVRIEISSVDANGADGNSYYDLNEVGLYVGDPAVGGGGSIIGPFDVFEIIKETSPANYVKYVLDPGSDITQATIGDYITVTNSTNPNNDVSSSLIVDIGYDEPPCSAFITVENPLGADEVASPAILNIQKRAYMDDIALFSRCTHSAIRKTIDREIVYLWKIYF